MKRICLLRWEWKLIELLKGHLRGEDHTEGSTSWPRKKSRRETGPWESPVSRNYSWKVKCLTHRQNYILYTGRQTPTFWLDWKSLETVHYYITWKVTTSFFTFKVASCLQSPWWRSTMHILGLLTPCWTLWSLHYSRFHVLNCLNVNSSERDTERKCEIWKANLRTIYLFSELFRGNYFQPTNSSLSDKTHKTILIQIHSLPDFFSFSGVVSVFEPSGSRLMLCQETSLRSQWVKGKA